MQKNKLTQLEYTKNNQTTLQAQASSKHYTSSEWLTFLQAKDLSLKIKKDEHGIRLSRVFLTDSTTTSTGQPKKALKFFTVFNTDQCELLTA